MISLDFSIAIALFNLFFLSSVLVAWLAGRKQKEKDFTLDPRHIWFCSICTHTYINTKEDVISVCPRCGNYNKR